MVLAVRPERRLVPSSQSNANEALRIMEMCDQAYANTMPMRRRMMTDWMLYTLDRFRWVQLLEDRIPRNTATITSNDPKTLAGTVIAQMVGAVMSVRAPASDQPEEVRRAGRAAEQLFLGILRQVDAQQTLMVNTKLRQQLCAYGALRGFFAVLHLLTKTEDGETVPHIEAWDPLNVYWGVSPGGRGPGGHPGLAWACHFQDLNAVMLDNRYSEEGNDVSGGLRPMYTNGNEPIYRVYDFYDRTHNIVVVDNKVIKKQEHFGMGYVPVSIVPIGNPLFIDAQASTAYTEEFGESVYSYNRDLYPKENAILSAKFEQLLRFINPAVTGASRTGRFRLPAFMANPFDRGQHIYLNTSNEEEIKVLEQPPMGRELGELEAAMSIMTQKGGLPSVVQGQSQTPASGYAHSLLQGSGLRHIVEPRLMALDQTYEGIETFIRRQFTSGHFDAMHLQGEIDRTTPFNVMIEPSVIRRAPEPVIKHKLKDPGETAAKVGLAQMLKTMGLGDDLYILDILDVDDPDAMMRRLDLQRVKEILPHTQLLASYRAAMELGDEEMAQLIMIDLMKIIGGPGVLPNPPGMMRGRQGQSMGGRGAPFVPTEAGGSPRSGAPNPSGPEQLQGRPRPPGTA